MLWRVPHAVYLPTMLFISGVMGQCNVGHFQSLTGLTSAEIVESVDYQLDEWSEHANDYCPSGRSVDSLFTTLQQYGLSSELISNIFRILMFCLPGGFRYLRRNNSDVSQYMLSFAGLLEGNSLLSIFSTSHYLFWRSFYLLSCA